LYYQKTWNTSGYHQFLQQSINRLPSALRLLFLYKKKMNPNKNHNPPKNTILMGDICFGTDKAKYTNQNNETSSGNFKSLNVSELREEK